MWGDKCPLSLTVSLFKGVVHLDCWSAGTASKQPDGSVKCHPDNLGRTDYDPNTKIPWEPFMFTLSDYELVDFGGQRKLERFGSVFVDRPSPVATGAREHPERWEYALRFDKTRNRWSKTPPREEWYFHVDALTFELTTTDSGQVGIFPEQADNWAWIQKRVSSRNNPKVLNLFGYTGASTLAAASAGAEVVHVDSSKSAVRWARRNANRSELHDAPIRWIVEDAPKFVRREFKRGNRYDGIILDPPSYGHGPKAEEWKLSRDLIELLGDCKNILADTPAFFLLSCHTSGFGEAELGAALTTCLFGSCAAGVRTQELVLSTREGRRLPAGHAAVWP